MRTHPQNLVCSKPMSTSDTTPGSLPAPTESGGGATAPGRRTKRSVYVWDRGAQLLITLGGVGVLAAVLGICLYLFSETLPLFHAGYVRDVRTFQPASAAGSRDLDPSLRYWTLLDEYHTSALVIASDGSYRAIELITGTQILEGSFARASAGSSAALSAVSFDAVTGALAAGYSDGSVRVGRARFESRSLLLEQARNATVPAHVLLPPQSIEKGLSVLDANAAATKTFARVVDGQVGLLSMPQSDEISMVNFVRPIVELSQPAMLELGEGGVANIDFRKGTSNEYLASLRTDGTGSLTSVQYNTPLGGGAPTTQLRTLPLKLSLPTDRPTPDRMIVTGDGGQLLMVWVDGFVQRYARPIDENPDNRAYELVQSFSLARDHARVTSLELLNGGHTVIVGLEDGTVSGWFVARDPGAGFRDGRTFVEAHSYPAASTPVTGITSSRRDRSFVVASQTSEISLWHMTSGKNITNTNAARGSTPIVSIGMSPRNEGVIALHTDGSLTLVGIEEGYPEASVRSLFGAVHYEGEAKPTYVYQSSASDNTAETKMNLRPLIHGTLKATVYAMLIAVPLGVLAAIYTSEFLHPDVRRYIKPVVELMASLPSVVLGFLAAFVVAPWVESYLPALLIGAFIVPIGIYFISLCWQTLPDHITRAMPSSGKFGLTVVALLVTMGIATLFGPTVERALFTPTRADVLTMAGSVEPLDRTAWPDWVGARSGVTAQEQRRLQRQGLVYQFGEVAKPVEPGAEWKADYDAVIEEAAYDQPSVRRWLDGSIASARPGWLLVMLLPCAILVFIVQSRLISRPWGNWIATLPHRKASLAEMFRFLVLLCATLALSFIVSSALASAGFDPRDSVFGSFTQRNSLVVGLIMGFAVIPLIYTISEDSLSSVPNSLRSASLGSGATRWQTTLRVVLPVAGSGIFSACMIGFGRAVGETMIVLMATGNTAVMDWNIFGGFRTLAANIAVELPEAPKGDAHFRVLFLCGLVLFVMTFIVNTTAELVRQHVRRKNAGL